MFLKGVIIINNNEFDDNMSLILDYSLEFENYMDDTGKEPKLLLDLYKEIDDLRQNKDSLEYQFKIEKTNEMHQLWNSRSLIMPKYQSNFLKKINEYEAKQAEDEEKEKIKKIVLVKEKEKYGDNIPLPPICEKLKGEREKSVNQNEQRKRRSTVKVLRLPEM